MLNYACVLPHPPLAVPSVGQGKESRIRNTLKAYKEVAGEIADIAPQTIVVITPHSINYADYFHISPGKEAQGDFAMFGVAETKLQAQYDESLAQEIAKLMPEAGEMGERDPSLDHGTTVPLWFVNEAYTDYKLVRISQSGMSAEDHYRLGQAIRKAAENLGRKVVLIASADLSHKLDTEDGKNYDLLAIRAMESGNFEELSKLSEEERRQAAECGHNSLMILAGAFEGVAMSPRLLSYEGPFGVGYAVADFKAYDEYQLLARASLEYTVNNGAIMRVPKDIPAEMLTSRAGVFVSIQKHGRLRGCIGTIAPSTENIAQEIMQNAVSAGLYDNRFNQVEAHELPHLSYKVDVLAEPEDIPDASYLDVKRYGVIVRFGDRRGLLLPNLEGIDSIEEQIAIACQKAGIPSGADIHLQRFEVIRHG